MYSAFSSPCFNHSGPSYGRAEIFRVKLLVYFCTQRIIVNSFFSNSWKPVYKNFTTVANNSEFSPTLISQRQSTPEYWRTGPGRLQTQPDTPRYRVGDLTRITQLESRVGDLASQLTQNFAMVEEVLHTQRDFKDILMRLVNSTATPAPTNAVHLTEATPPPSNNGVAASALPGNPINLEDNEGQDLPAHSSQPSWMSAETVLLTPNTRNTLGPHRAGRADMVAVSTDVSDHSFANGSMNDGVEPS